MTSTARGSAPAAEKTTPTRLAIGTAAIVLVAWLVLAAFLITRTSIAEVEWARLAWVFASVEAVAFAGAGLLFGTTVNRQRAEKAEEQAEANKKDAEAGRALAAAIKADDVEVLRDSGSPKPAGGDASAADFRALDTVARHSRLARQLFP